MGCSYDLLSKLASGLATRKVVDLVEANNVVRRTMATKPRLRFRSGMQSRDCAHVALHDASFDNMPNHKRQRGVVVLLACRDLLSDQHGRHLVPPILWASGRITRVVESTLSAEAYSCTEALDALNRTRTVMVDMTLASSSAATMGMPVDDVGAIVTDCRFLWDCVTMERVNLTDRRLSLEAALLRQECQSCEIKWVKSEQQLADVLSKDMEREHTRNIFESNM